MTARSENATIAGRPRAGVYANILEMVGNTPLLELRKLDTGPCALFAKMESLNPANSIKDRIGVSMIESAEREGKIDPNADPKPTIIEATAGNTGLALALVAGQRGYKLLVVVPDKMSQEKIQHLRAMGAQVVMARSDVTKGHPEYYQEVAARIAKETPNSYYINQFCNEDNIRAHYETTAPEIWEQMEGKVDAVVVGVGSGGTLTGIGRFMKEHNPECKMILADPSGSILWPLVNEGKTVEPGSWLIEGMGEDFVPDICDIEMADEAVPVTDAEAFLAARELLAKEGVLGGSSTGCLIHAAMVWCRKQTKPLRVATFVCDSGAKYLSKMFNDYWMIDNGFIQRETTGDLRDLIARRHELREDHTVEPDMPLKQAFKMMRLYDVSQIAVLAPPARGQKHERVVGIIDESDVLLAMHHESGAFDRPVSDFMTSRLETIPPTASVNDLMPIFRADRVAIVSDKDGAYHGLITRIDLINYLRNQMPQ
ncbi:MAG: pyridoxal-phosphate dependent enzyme [Phycisphaerales bacterium]|nr:MAG: pyridoxal-phosphate dependent enzyme [Phycisphaerales bacterium]